jgi:hypothetical protein
MGSAPEAIATGLTLAGSSDEAAVARRHHSRYCLIHNQSHNLRPELG